jgi:hypothetical protein
MQNEFVPYTEALALKELGFDEPCFGLYHNDKTFYPTQCKSHEQYHGQICSAPLYQQVFKFFREKHRISPVITCYSELGNAWKYHIPNEGGEKGFYTYEEAELECLVKLIEIVKNQTKN